MDWITQYQKQESDINIVKAHLLKLSETSIEQTQSEEILGLQKSMGLHRSGEIKVDLDANFNNLVLGAGLTDEWLRSSQQKANQDISIALNPHVIGHQAHEIPEKQEQKILFRSTTSKGKQPTPMEITQELVHSATFVLVDRALYWFDGKIFRILDTVDLCRLIYSFCKFDIYKYGKPNIVNEIAAFMRMTDDVVAIKPIRDPHLFAFPKAYYHSDTDTCEFPTSQYFCTTLLNASYIELKDAHCPKFDAFICNFAKGDVVLINMIWEIIGYLFSSNMSAKKFFYLYGQRDTGKSVLLSFIRACFEDEFTASVDVHDLNERFTMSSLVGKHINVNADLRQGQLKEGAVSKIKQLVSGADKIPAEKKFEQSFQFNNVCKLIFASNHSLLLPYGENDFYEKMLIIPCLNQISKEHRDSTLLEKLIAEKDSVIRIAIEHYKRLVANNMIFTGEDIYTPETVFSMGNRPVSVEQLIREFTSEHCVFESEAYTHTQTLSDRFTMLYGTQLDSTALSNYLRSICGDKIKPDRRRFAKQNRHGYWGIRLKDNEQSGEPTEKFN